MPSQHAPQTATAHAPSHITGFFKMYKNGSTGAGVNLKEGMTTRVSARVSKKQKTAIYINGKKSTAPTSRSVVKKFLALRKEKFEIKVSHKTKIPIGFGLGISGAGALSLSLALNKALGTRLTKKQALKIAFDAEIENATGLGDVIAQQFSGVIRGLPPFPSKKAKKIPTNKKYCVCAFFAPIKTSTIIKSMEWKKKVNKAGTYCMKHIAKKPTLENFIRLSRAFSIESNLATKKVRKVMEKIPSASQAMLGSTAFVITDRPAQATGKLKKFCTKVISSRIAQKGAMVL